MQIESAAFTKSDLAKYPFLKQTAEYIKSLDLQIDNLASIGSDQILNRAEERVIKAITEIRVPKCLKTLDDEITSFPLALLIVIATENSFIKKRYALAEAKQTSSDLINFNESKQKILKIAEDFEWKIKINSKENLDSPLEFRVNFVDYLRNAAHMHDKKWKLTNSILSHGEVYLNKKDVVRLLQEEVRRRIERRLDLKLASIRLNLQRLLKKSKR